MQHFTLMGLFQPGHQIIEQVDNKGLWNMLIFVPPDLKMTSQFPIRTQLENHYNFVLTFGEKTVFKADNIFVD